MWRFFHFNMFYLIIMFWCRHHKIECSCHAYNVFHNLSYPFRCFNDVPFLEILFPFPLGHYLGHFCVPFPWYPTYLSVSLHCIPHMRYSLSRMPLSCLQQRWWHYILHGCSGSLLKHNQESCSVSMQKPQSRTWQLVSSTSKWGQDDSPHKLWRLGQNEQVRTTQYQLNMIKLIPLAYPSSCKS